MISEVEAIEELATWLVCALSASCFLPSVAVMSTNTLGLNEWLDGLS